MSDTTLQLGEPADEADWRALVERGLKGAPWSRLVGVTSDGIAIEPLYREPDIATAGDEAGMPGAAPYIRGARAGAWVIRQAYEHPDPVQTNDEILADLQGGAGGIELVLDPAGKSGVAVRDARELDIALSKVLIDIAPVSFDAAADAPADYLPKMISALGQKLGGVSSERGIGFNLDPIGRLMRCGACEPDQDQFVDSVSLLFEAFPDSRAVRVDARPVHEAGGAEAQEIAAALCSGIEYLRWLDGELSLNETAPLMGFALSVGPDVLIETAKLRALRLCWARVLEAGGVDSANRAAHIHAFTSRRMMTRYDPLTNILRVTTAAFAAAIGGADDITTYPFTDALGLPTAFARRVARNTQHVLMEECRLGHVADPAGGAWFVEKLTRDLAAKAWEIMQSIEAGGGIVASLHSGNLQKRVADARTARQKLIATRRETITGVTDFPLLDEKTPAFYSPTGWRGAERSASGGARLIPIRWAEPFETLRARAETRTPRPTIFFANLGTLSAFGPRAQFARNLFAAGGVGAFGEETQYPARDAMIDAFRASDTRVAVICGTDEAYAKDAENAAQRVKAAGADWVVVAGKPGDAEAKYRGAGVDQFIHVGVDVLKELETLHAALGVA